MISQDGFFINRRLNPVNTNQRSGSQQDKHQIIPTQTPQQAFISEAQRRTYLFPPSSSSSSIHTFPFIWKISNRQNIWYYRFIVLCCIFLVDIFTQPPDQIDIPSDSPAARDPKDAMSDKPLSDAVFEG
ncbi:hypothetical protein Pfo_015706 [Paulownia fortunei]|nr:hypothetical protein Pfo_015706 [Paulownia fortunei]